MLDLSTLIPSHKWWWWSKEVKSFLSHKATVLISVFLALS